MYRPSLLALSVLLVVAPSAGYAAKGKEDRAPVVALPVPGAPGQLTTDTAVKLIVVDRYASGSSKKGERVNLRIDDDVTDSQGTVLIRKGTPAYGTVTASRSAGIFGKRGLLDVSIDHTTAVDGQKVELRATKAKSGKNNTGVAVASILFFAPVALFIKGSNVTLKPGTEIIGYVDSPVAVGSAPATSAPPAAAVAAPTAPSGPAKLLVLRNGDKITGSVQGLADGLYTVATANGTLKIKAEDVKEITDATE